MSKIKTTTTISCKKLTSKEAIKAKPTKVGKLLKYSQAYNI